jgi:hypothetical protein
VGEVEDVGLGLDKGVRGGECGYGCGPRTSLGVGMGVGVGERVGEGNDGTNMKPVTSSEHTLQRCASQRATIAQSIGTCPLLHEMMGGWHTRWNVEHLTDSVMPV